MYSISLAYTHPCKPSHKACPLSPTCCPSSPPPVTNWKAKCP